MNEPTLESWVDALSCDDPAARKRAFAHLLSEGPNAIPGLMAVVKAPTSSPALSSLVAELLSQVPEAMEELIGVLAHPDLSVRSTATYALACMGSAAVEALIGSLDSESLLRRQHAAMALGRIGDEKAIAALVRCFRDPHSEVQSTAAFSLGQIGIASLPAVAEATRDPDPSIRRLAVLAIAKIGHFKAMPVLSELMEIEVDPEVNKAIRRALEGIMMQPGLIDTD